MYVTDQVEGIVPEYLTLLHGVIDSPDIPLNVSRSYLQSDSNVKKISNYITRKVADRLQELFTTMRADYEQKWDDLKIFIEYGIITDEKFAAAIKAATEELTQLFYKMSEKLYQQQAPQGDPNMGGQQPGGDPNGGQQYYDADYKVVDDDDQNNK